MSNSDEIRWQQRLEHFNDAMKPLADACEQVSYSILERAGLIQFFEVCFEMAWKTLQDLLSYEGSADIGGARSVLREAHRLGWIDDIDTWLTMLDYRNRTTHAYDEQAAQEIVENIRQSFYPALQRLLDRLNAKQKEQYR
jgi:nucleotidyltransferase substrate binding protein (TIGR01987 family)